MPKPENTVRREYQQEIQKVLHYIHQNLSGDVSLETLAGIASYSPFHFQKIFSEALQESPKQYVIRLRLERAGHFIKIFPDLPISEIAMGCGFSSASVFSRAFRNYFGITAEVFREMPPNRLHEIGKSKFSSDGWEEPAWIEPIEDMQGMISTARLSPAPEVETRYPFRIGCVQTTLSHKENIAFAFKTLLQWAAPQNLISASTRYFGVWLDIPFITPLSKCRYLCGIELTADIKPPKSISVVTLNKGLYVNYPVSGTMNDTIRSLIALNHNFIESMGYAISEMICYEQFDECPAGMTYEQIQRNLLIPVKSNPQVLQSR
jgi:AraC family transcriptional regulator